MLKTDLLELIANGENTGVEFKRDDLRLEQLAKDVAAMANVKGGRILLGVEDDGTITGIQRPNLEEWVMDGVFGTKVHPMILPFYEEVRIDDATRAAVISFDEGVSKPYVVRDQGLEDVFIRVGTTSRLASREQQARLFASGGILHAEVLPVTGTSLESLDRQRLHDYHASVLNDPDIPNNEDEWIQRLLSLGFLVKGTNDVPVCTIAGLILFGSSPRRFLKQSGIRVMAFKGNDKTYQASLDTVIDSPATGLWTVDSDGHRTMTQSGSGLVERLVDKLVPFVADESADIDEGFRRQQAWHYPREAIREVLINAIAHRDWTRSTDIEVVVYSDRLEVVSPGGLQNSMTIEKMLAGQRSPRNPLIVETLRDYGYVDARGMGVRTKVIPLMREQNKTEPEFILTDDYLKVVLWR